MKRRDKRVRTWSSYSAQQIKISDCEPCLPWNQWHVWWEEGSICQLQSLVEIHHHLPALKYFSGLYLNRAEKLTRRRTHLHHCSYLGIDD
jgi:hypothetical protein